MFKKGLITLEEQNRDDLARLDFPPTKFVLNRGRLFSPNVSILGCRLICISFYCAFTNQFVKLHIKEINYKTSYFLKKMKFN